MGTVNGGFSGQGRRRLGGLAHLLGRALEEAAATTDKESIATEQDRPAFNLDIGEIGNMVEGMAWHAQNLESYVFPDHLIAGVNQIGAAFERRLGGAGHTAIRKTRDQLFYTTR